MAKLISKTYGDALLEVAVEDNKVDLFAEEIAGIGVVLQENPDFGKLINNPTGWDYEGERYVYDAIILTDKPDE